MNQVACLPSAHSALIRSEQHTLAKLADVTGAELRGCPSRIVSGLATPTSATSHDLTFVSDARHAAQLIGTNAAAVILPEQLAAQCMTNCLVVENPHLAYAKVSGIFDRSPVQPKGIHPSAFIDPSVVMGADVRIGAHCCIEAGTRLSDGVVVGAGSCIGANSSIGTGCRIAANVTIYHGVSVGRRTRIHSGSVIGSDGFGYATSVDGWVKIHQLGGVIIGDDVEIGACTSIDRGALGDTIIGNGVVIDNQVQIAHNVEIGDNTALAGCVGIAGSVTIGANCILGGGVGVADHLSIADNVTVSGMTLVSKSIKEAGVYSSGTALCKHAEWQRNAVRFTQLDQLHKRLTKLEKEIRAHYECASYARPTGASEQTRTVFGDESLDVTRHDQVTRTDDAGRRQSTKDYNAATRKAA